MVRHWIHHPPAWLHIVAVCATPDAILGRLHRGEQETILLGEQLSADLLLLDEKAPRRSAIGRGLNVTGLIGILDQAATVGLIDDIPEVVARLNATSLRVAPRVLKHVLEKHVKRKT